MNFGNQIVLNTLQETPIKQLSPYINRDADKSVIEILKLKASIKMTKKFMCYIITEAKSRGALDFEPSNLIGNL